MTTNDIRYVYNAKTGIELIFCDNSTISYPLHNHVSVLTLGIVLDGSIGLTVNQETAAYTKDRTFVISPYVPHSISAHSRYTLLSLCIDKNVAKNSATHIIWDNIMALLSDTLLTNKLTRHQIQLLANRLHTFADLSAWHPGGHTDSVRALQKQLELHPESKLSIAEMAQNAYTSKYHFIRKFKEETGLTPHQFQLQNRIRKAQRLIHQTETITEVALITGFCDQSHFIKQFKKYVGLPPMTYKRSSDTIRQEKDNQHSAGINFANR